MQLHRNNLMLGHISNNVVKVLNECFFQLFCCHLHLKVFCFHKKFLALFNVFSNVLIQILPEFNKEPTTSGSGDTSSALNLIERSGRTLFWRFWRICRLWCSFSSCWRGWVFCLEWVLGEGPFLVVPLTGTMGVPEK